VCLSILLTVSHHHTRRDRSHTFAYHFDYNGWCCPNRRSTGNDRRQPSVTAVEAAPCHSTLEQDIRGPTMEAKVQHRHHIAEAVGCNRRDRQQDTQPRHQSSPSCNRHPLR
jgi:hypothetical protein